MVTVRERIEMSTSKLPTNLVATAIQKAIVHFNDPNGPKFVPNPADMAKPFIDLVTATEKTYGSNPSFIYVSTDDFKFIREFY
jgi:hypothetical protein